MEKNFVYTAAFRLEELLQQQKIQKILKQLFKDPTRTELSKPKHTKLFISGMC